MPVYPNQRYALARRLRARFCSRRAQIAVAQGAQRRNHRRKTAGIRRTSVNENVPQQRWAAQRQAGSDGDTRLARGYIIYDGWCSCGSRGADSTVVAVPTGATSGSGPRQDAAGALLLSVHDRSWLSPCRAKSAGSVSRSKSRTTEQLKRYADLTWLESTSSTRIWIKSTRPRCQ